MGTRSPDFCGRPLLQQKLMIQTTPFSKRASNQNLHLGIPQPGPFLWGLTLFKGVPAQAVGSEDLQLELQ